MQSAVGLPPSGGLAGAPGEHPGDGRDLAATAPGSLHGVAVLFMKGRGLSSNRASEEGYPGLLHRMGIQSWSENLFLISWRLNWTSMRSVDFPMGSWEVK